MFHYYYYYYEPGFFCMLLSHLFLLLCIIYAYFVIFMENKYLLEYFVIQRPNYCMIEHHNMCYKVSTLLPIIYKTIIALFGNEFQKFSHKHLISTWSPINLSWFLLKRGLKNRNIYYRIIHHFRILKKEGIKNLKIWKFL